MALVLNDDFSMWQFRGGLIRNLVDRGHDVVAIVPPGAWNNRIRGLDARVYPVPMRRFVSPAGDLVLIWRLWRILKKERVDLVHTMTIKPNIYGTVAARLAGVPRIVGLVSGAGTVLTKRQGLTSRLQSWMAARLYRLAFRWSDGCWFQNPDDLDEFVGRKLIPREKGVVIRSGGINLDEYHPDVVPKEEIDALRGELGIPQDAGVVLMLTARMIWSKGVREFLKAAALLRDSHPGWIFVLLSPRDDADPDSVPNQYVQRWRGDNLVVIDRFRQDTKRFHALADVAVLPSYYREGVPRSLLEALAMAKPIVTTNAPGCREAVSEGENGYRVAPRDSRALADRLAWLLDDARLRRAFGCRSRSMAEESFSEAHVVQRVIGELYRI